MKIGHHYRTNFYLEAYTDTSFMTKVKSNNLEHVFSFFVVDKTDLSIDQSCLVRCMQMSEIDMSKDGVEVAYKVIAPDFIGWIPLYTNEEKAINECGRYDESGDILEEVLVTDPEEETEEERT